MTTPNTGPAPLAPPRHGKPARKRAKGGTHDRAHHTYTLLDVSSQPAGMVDFTIPRPMRFGRSVGDRVCRLPVYDAVIAVDTSAVKKRALRYADVKQAYGRSTVTTVDHIRRCGIKLHHMAGFGASSPFMTTDDFERLINQDFLPGKDFYSNRIGPRDAVFGVPFGPTRVMPVIEVSPGQYRFRVRDIAMATGLSERSVYGILYRGEMTSTKTTCVVVPTMRDGGRGAASWSAEPLVLAWMWTLFKHKIRDSYGVCQHKLLATHAEWNEATEGWEYRYPGVTPVGAGRFELKNPLPQNPAVEQAPQVDVAAVALTDEVPPEPRLPYSPKTAAREEPSTPVAEPATTLTPEVRDEVLALLDELELGH